MSPKSLQAQLNDLRTQHKNLKRKVTKLTRRVRTLEPFARARDREHFILAVYEIIAYLEEKKRRDLNRQRETYSKTA